MYVPANVMPSVFTVKHEVINEETGLFKKVGGGDGYMRPGGAPRSGTLTAMDPTTNKIVWPPRRSRFRAMENTPGAVAPVPLIGQLWRKL